MEEALHQTLAADAEERHTGWNVQNAETAAENATAKAAGIDGWGCVTPASKTPVGPSPASKQTSSGGDFHMLAGDATAPPIRVEASAAQGSRILAVPGTMPRTWAEASARGLAVLGMTPLT